MCQFLCWCHNPQIFFRPPPKVAPALLDVARWFMSISVLPSFLLIATKDFRGAGKAPTARKDLWAWGPQLRADVIPRRFFGTPQVNGKEAEA